MPETENLSMTVNTADDGTRTYTVDTFPELVYFDAEILKQADARVLWVSVLVAINVENGEACYEYHNNPDRDGGTTHDPEQHPSTNAFRLKRTYLKTKP